VRGAAHGSVEWVSEHRVVVTTTDSAAAARGIAERLVRARLAACVQISGPVESIYRWDGAVVRDQEWQCWVKTTADRVDELTDWLVENHDYDVPEVLALPVLGGNPAYLSWVTAETRPDDA